MTTATATTAATTNGAAPTVSSVPATSSVNVSEGSNAGRFVALFTPVFVIVAGWAAGFVGKHVPGAQLDQTQIVTFMTAASASALGSAYKWLQGWQQHEQRVAEGIAEPVKQAVAAVTA
jgi:hypothetical protein